MSLSKKFALIILGSIMSIALINILAFYLFYGSYLTVYLAEKVKTREDITIEYINNIIEQQALDEIDNIFSDIEIEFFELLENSEGNISLESQENVDIVINYLIKSGVTPKYIEEIIPSNNFQQVLKEIRRKDSPESNFISRLSYSVILVNIFAILGIVGGILFITKNTIRPIRKVTSKIKNIHLGKNYEEIHYKNNDEIGLLIGSINELNKNLHIQEDIRSQLLADISHELKTPITSIQCYLEGIKDGVIQVDDKVLNSIVLEMSRLTKLVNMIMDYEKFENQEIELQFTQENIAETTKQVLHTHSKRLSEIGQRIKLTGDEKLEKNIDRDLFKQVVHNIIGNFIKYAGEDTLMTINITKKYIEFSDNGAGIKQSALPFLTEKFYQGKREKTGILEKRGIGVGLSIVEKVINQHGWKMEIKSDLGKGFRIKIFFS